MYKYPRPCYASFRLCYTHNTKLQGYLAVKISSYKSAEAPPDLLDTASWS